MAFFVKKDGVFKKLKIQVEGFEDLQKKEDENIIGDNKNLVSNINLLNAQYQNIANNNGYDDEYIDILLNNKADVDHTHSQYLTEHQSLTGLATTDKTIVGGINEVNTLLRSIRLVSENNTIKLMLGDTVLSTVEINGGSVVTPTDPPIENETIVGTIDDNNIISLNGLESGTYTLRYEDDNGILEGYDIITTMEV